MPRFDEWVWYADNIAHLWRHRVEHNEVEEACVAGALVFRGPGGLYRIFGRTKAGRYLFVIVRDMGRGGARCVTARDMTGSERRRYGRG